MERPPSLDRLPLLRELMVTSDRFLDAVATLATLPCCFHVASMLSPKFQNVTDMMDMVV